MRSSGDAATPVMTATADTLGVASDATRQAMTDLRTLIVDIAPPNLIAEGIDNALRDLLDPFASRGVDVHLDVDRDIAASPEETALLYRAGQEALRNIAKHAQATRIDVRLRRWGERIRLEVEDDGMGFDDEQLDRSRADGHMGLSLLRDLVTEGGGTVALTSRAGAGTRVAIEMPATTRASSTAR